MNSEAKKVIKDAKEKENELLVEAKAPPDIPVLQDNMRKMPVPTVDDQQPGNKAKDIVTLQPIVPESKMFDTMKSQLAPTVDNLNAEVRDVLALQSKGLGKMIPFTDETMRVNTVWYTTDKIDFTASRQPSPRFKNKVVCLWNFDVHDIDKKPVLQYGLHIGDFKDPLTFKAAHYHLIWRVAAAYGGIFKSIPHGAFGIDNFHPSQTKKTTAREARGADVQGWAGMLGDVRSQGVDRHFRAEAYEKLLNKMTGSIGVREQYEEKGYEVREWNDGFAEPLEAKLQMQLHELEFHQWVYRGEDRIQGIKDLHAFFTSAFANQFKRVKQIPAGTRLTHFYTVFNYNQEAFCHFMKTSIDFRMCYVRIMYELLRDEALFSTNVDADEWTIWWKTLSVSTTTYNFEQDIVKRVSKDASVELMTSVYLADLQRYSCGLRYEIPKPEEFDFAILAECILMKLIFPRRLFLHGTIALIDNYIFAHMICRIKRWSGMAIPIGDEWEDVNFLSRWLDNAFSVPVEFSLFLRTRDDGSGWLGAGSHGTEGLPKFGSRFMDGSDAPFNGVPSRTYWYQHFCGKKFEPSTDELEQFTRYNNFVNAFEKYDLNPKFPYGMRQGRDNPFITILKRFVMKRNKLKSFVAHMRYRQAIFSLIPTFQVREHELAGVRDSGVAPLDIRMGAVFFFLDFLIFNQNDLLRNENDVFRLATDSTRFLDMRAVRNDEKYFWFGKELIYAMDQFASHYNMYLMGYASDPLIAKYVTKGEIASLAAHSINISNSSIKALLEKVVFNEQLHKTLDPGPRIMPYLLAQFHMCSRFIREMYGHMGYVNELFYDSNPQLLQVTTGDMAGYFNRLYQRRAVLPSKETTYFDLQDRYFSKSVKSLFFPAYDNREIIKVIMPIPYEFKPIKKLDFHQPEPFLSDYETDSKDSFGVTIKKLELYGSWSETTYDDNDSADAFHRRPLFHAERGLLPFKLMTFPEIIDTFHFRFEAYLDTFERFDPFISMVTVLPPGNGVM